MMKAIITILLFCVSLSAFSQGNGRTAWNDLFTTLYYHNPVKFNEIHLQSRSSLANSSQDTSSAFLYLVHDTLPMLYYKGKNYTLGGGTTNIGDGSGVAQDVKDTTITWDGTRTFADLPSGITYNPFSYEVTVTSSASTEGDNGQGFNTTYTYSTQTLSIYYPFAPIGTFLYHIKYTKPK